MKLNGEGGARNMLFTFFKGDRSTLLLDEKENGEKGREGPYSAFPDEVREVLESTYTREKGKIYYHRSYRKLAQRSMSYVILSLLVLVVLVDFLVVFFYPEITNGISEIARSALSTAVPGELIEVVPRNYIYDNVFVVTMPGRYPTLKLSIIVAIVSLTFFFLAFYLKRVVDPKLVWLIFISFINFVSAVFFIFFAGYFPYDLEIFSEMYIKTEVGIWVIIPFIMTIALLPFPIRLFKKLLVILLTLGYSIVFACVRYIVFLYLLRSTTYLFMALMFFMLGPFLDFLYIVGSYSLLLSSAGKQTQKKMELWNWLY
jgi:hypothetical protein